MLRSDSSALLALIPLLPKVSVSCTSSGSVNPSSFLALPLPYGYGGLLLFLPFPTPKGPLEGCSSKAYGKLPQSSSAKQPLTGSPKGLLPSVLPKGCAAAQPGTQQRGRTPAKGLRSCAAFGGAGFLQRPALGIQPKGTALWWVPSRTLWLGTPEKPPFAGSPKGLLPSVRTDTNEGRVPGKGPAPPKGCVGYPACVGFLPYG